MSIVAVYQTYCEGNNIPMDEKIKQVLDAINQKHIISNESKTGVIINKSDGVVVNDQTFGAIIESVKRYANFKNSA